MTQPILDQLRSVAHDAGAATGVAVSGLSEGALDAIHSLDTDRVSEITAPYIGVAAGAASGLGRWLTTKRVLIGLGTLAAVGIIAVAILRFRRRGDRQDSAPVSVHGESPSRDGRGAHSKFGSRVTQVPEAVAARG